MSPRGGQLRGHVARTRTRLLCWRRARRGHRPRGGGVFSPPRGELAGMEQRDHMMRRAALRNSTIRRLAVFPHSFPGRIQHARQSPQSGPGSVWAGGKSGRGMPDNESSWARSRIFLCEEERTPVAQSAAPPPSCSTRFGLWSPKPRLFLLDDALIHSGDRPSRLPSSLWLVASCSFAAARKAPQGRCFVSRRARVDGTLGTWGPGTWGGPSVFAPARTYFPRSLVSRLFFSFTFTV